MPVVLLWLQDVADITAALEGELKELRQDKQDMEAQYLSQIVAALSLLRKAEVDYGNSCSEPSSMPPDFLCPITMCLMRDPVILETGHSFERLAIQRHLATKNTNPITSEWSGRASGTDHHNATLAMYRLIAGPLSLDRIDHG